MTIFGFDLLCERFARERAQLTHLADRWVVYTREGVVADFATEQQANRAAFDSHGETEFLIDQILPERPTVFIGGGGHYSGTL